MCLAVQVLPALGEFPSEARLNLVIHHLRAGRVAEAEALVQDINPNTPPEYILKVGCAGMQCLTHELCLSASTLNRASVLHP